MTKRKQKRETMTDLTTQTPVEIDTQLATLSGERFTAAYQVMSAADSVHRAARDKSAYRYGRGSKEWTMSLDEALDAAQEIADTDATYIGQQAKSAIERFTQAQAEVAAIEAKMAPLNAEFKRRGGWTRAFLVTNANGHVHKSMDCSTCNRGGQATQFQWMTAYSDHAESEIVADAGWRACTVCYPSAPVNGYSSEKAAQAALPTKMFSKSDEEKAAARKEREEAKAARDATKKKNAPTLSGEPLTVVTERSTRTFGPRAGEPYESKETFQTERSAMIWATDQVARREWGVRPETTEVTEALVLIAKKIAEKRGVETSVVLAEIKAKGEKKGKANR